MNKDRMRYDPATDGLVGEHNGMVVRVSGDAYHQECRDQIDPLCPPEYHAGQGVVLSDEFYAMCDTLWTPTYWLEKGER